MSDKQKDHGKKKKSRPTSGRMNGWDESEHPEEMYHVWSTKATACLCFGFTSVSHPILRNEAIDLRSVTFKVKQDYMPCHLNGIFFSGMWWTERRSQNVLFLFLFFLYPVFLYSLQGKGKKHHVVDVFQFNVIWDKKKDLNDITMCFY